MSVNNYNNGAALKTGDITFTATTMTPGQIIKFLENCPVSGITYISGVTYSAITSVNEYDFVST